MTAKMSALISSSKPTTVASSSTLTAAASAAAARRMNEESVFCARDESERCFDNCRRRCPTTLMSIGCQLDPIQSDFPEPAPADPDSPAFQSINQSINQSKITNRPSSIFVHNLNHKCCSAPSTAAVKPIVHYSV